MRIRPGVLFAVVAVLALVFGGRYLGLFGGKDRTETPTNAASGSADGVSVVVSPSPPDPAPPPAPRPPPVVARTAPGTSPPVGTAPDPSTAAAVAPAGAIKDWEQRIDTLLTAPGDEAAKSKELLAMLPNLPEDGQVEAAQHLSNLLADEDFKLLTPTLTNATVSEEVLDVLMTDVLNRPNELKLPALLDVARIPNHPKAEDARDILEVYVDENYGEDWTAWRAAVDKWLKENPDE
jgi:hypothetical protein